MKKIKFIKFFIFLLMILPIFSFIISCSNQNEKKNTLFASRSIIVDQMIALGIAPRWIRKTKQGQMIEKYLKPFVNESKIKNIDQQKPWSQSIDKEKIASLQLKGAFISNFQFKLYKNLKDAGLEKSQIGFSTMGETYFPDLDYKITEFIEKKQKFSVIKNKWNQIHPNNKIVLTSEDLSKDPIKMYDVQKPNSFINDSGENADQNGNWIPKSGGGYNFNYSFQFDKSFEILAKNIDQILKNEAKINNLTALQRAKKINQATKESINKTRIALINKISANKTNNKSIIAFKPNYNASNANEIINKKFAWDPTIFSFLYSRTNGMAFKMPKYDSSKGSIKYLENDVDGLEANNQEAILEMFKNQSDYVLFLKPEKYNIDEQEIKNKLKKAQKNSDISKIIIVDEDLWYQGNFGVIGTNLLIDDFASKFNLLEIKNSRKNWNWNWNIIKEKNVKIFGLD